MYISNKSFLLEYTHTTAGALHGKGGTKLEDATLEQKELVKYGVIMDADLIDLDNMVLNIEGDCISFEDLRSEYADKVGLAKANGNK